MKCRHCNNDLELKAKLIKKSADHIRKIIYQWWKCKKCKHVYFGELTEYISDGSYEHAFYNADPGIWKKDLKILKKDPENTNFMTHYTERIDYSYIK